MDLFHPFRDHRRKALAERPFPAEWSAIIARDVPYVRALHPDERKHLETLIQIFIAEKYFEGCGGLEVTDEMRVTVAARKGNTDAAYEHLEEALIRLRQANAETHPWIVAIKTEREELNAKT